MNSVCSNLRPDWDGTPVSMLSETGALLASPISLLLMIATLGALRYKSQWGSVAIAVGWSVYTAFLTTLDPGDQLANARIEGCLGSPSLFITLVAAICIGMILFTAPKERHKT